RLRTGLRSGGRCRRGRLAGLALRRRRGRGLRRPDDTSGPSASGAGLPVSGGLGDACSWPAPAGASVSPAPLSGVVTALAVAAAPGEPALAGAGSPWLAATGLGGSSTGAGGPPAG